MNVRPESFARIQINLGVNEMRNDSTDGETK